MHALEQPQSPRHLFTVDVEEYFHVSAFEAVIPRDTWERWPSRLHRSMPALLSELARVGAKGTFFVLGWVARHHPNIVRDIIGAGHEVASHGFWHRRVTSLTPAEFREDVRASKQELEDLCGLPVLGYRAPSFSIVPGGEWAFDVLLEEGYRYDSSIFPIRRRGYGYPSAPRDPYVLRRPGGTLAEIPLATASIAGIVIPAAGGGYLRHFPFALIRRAFTQAAQRGVPATFYLHPWEIDPEQPRVAVGALTRVRHYRGLSRTMDRLRRLLDEFPFTSIASQLEQADAPPSRRVAGSV